MVWTLEQTLGFIDAWKEVPWQTRFRCHTVEQDWRITCSAGRLIIILHSWGGRGPSNTIIYTWLDGDMSLSSNSSGVDRFLILHFCPHSKGFSVQKFLINAWKDIYPSIRLHSLSSWNPVQKATVKGWSPNKILKKVGWSKVIKITFIYWANTEKKFSNHTAFRCSAKERQNSKRVTTTTTELHCSLVNCLR